MNIEKKRSFIINFIFYVIIAGIAVLLLKYAVPMLATFILGFLIAFIMRKPTKYIQKKIQVGHKLVAIFMVLLFYATVGVLAVILVIKAISGVQTLVLGIPRIYETEILPLLRSAFSSLETTLLMLDPSLSDILNKIGNQGLQTLGNMISSLSAWAVTTVTNLATSIPGLFIKFVLMVISSLFIAADYDILCSFCARQLNEPVATLLKQIREYMIGTLFVCIRSYLIIMSLTFVELSIGLTLAGLKYSVLIAAFIAVFDILPVLGTGGIMLPWVVITLLGGNFALALKLLLIYLAVTVIRNIIEPKIVGGQLGLHPVVTLISMSVGLQLFGAIGLFGFPIMLSLLRHLNDNGTIHILK